MNDFLHAAIKELEDNPNLLDEVLQEHEESIHALAEKGVDIFEMVMTVVNAGVKLAELASALMNGNTPRKLGMKGEQQAAAAHIAEAVQQQPRTNHKKYSIEAATPQELSVAQDIAAKVTPTVPKKTKSV